MAAYFNAHAILSGHIDFYCLLCEDLFKHKEDVFQHVATEQHKNKLEKTEYLNSYPRHYIKKLKKCFYCEFCNEALTTVIKLRSHVKTPTHRYLQETKKWFYTTSTLNLSWSGDDVLVSQFLVKEKAWRGILDDGTCLICDEEIESFEEHKKLWSHVLKLAQKKFIIGKDSLIRKIDGALYQCLICNAVCNDMDKHNSSLIHIMMYKKLQGNVMSSKHCVESNDEEKSSGGTTSANLEDDDKEATATGGAAAKKYQDSQGGKPNSATISETVQTFAKANNITFDGTVALCTTCKVKVPYNLKNMKEHVNGYMHKLNKSYEKEAAEESAKAEKPSSSKDEAKKGTDNNKPYKTKQFSDFIASMSQRLSIVEETRDFLINGEIYMEMLPLLMITRAGNQLVCQMCEKTMRMNSSEVGKHLHSKAVVNGVKRSHETIISGVPVVTDFKRELIREVRPNIFHCGYCNIVVTGWDEINRHLNTMVHNRQKIEAGWKAEQFKQEADERQGHACRMVQALHMFNVIANAFE